MDSTLEFTKSTFVYTSSSPFHGRKIEAESNATPQACVCQTLVQMPQYNVVSSEPPFEHQVSEHW